MFTNSKSIFFVRIERLLWKPEDITGRISQSQQPNDEEQTLPSMSSFRLGTFSKLTQKKKKLLERQLEISYLAYCMFLDLKISVENFNNFRLNILLVQL